MLSQSTRTQGKWLRMCSQNRIVRRAIIAYFHNHMLTHRKIVREFADATGYTPAALEHHCRYLRAADQFSLDRKEPRDYANLLMSFAGLQSVDAPVAARSLRYAIHLAVMPDPEAKPDEPGNLGDVLEAMIQGVAKAIILEHQGEPEEAGLKKHLPDFITFRLNPYVATLAWMGRPEMNGQAARPGKVLTYARTGSDEGPPTEPRRGALTRETTITGDLIYLAARLWAQTLLEEGSSSSSSSKPTPGGATTRSKNERRRTPPQGPAPSINPAAPNTTQTRGNTPKPHISACVFGEQPPNRAPAGQPLLTGATNGLSPPH